MEHTVKKLFGETCSLVDTKKYSEALSTCNQALSLEPENEELLFLRAQIYAFMGEKNKAIDESEKLLSKNPEMTCAVQTILALDEEIENLAEKLDSEEESIRKKAIEDLSKYNRPSAAFLLSDCIIHDEELYWNAADALHQMGPFTIPFLYKAFIKTVKAPCAVAYTTIYDFGDAALPYLQDLLEKGEDEYHINRLIARIKGEEDEDEETEIL